MKLVNVLGRISRGGLREKTDPSKLREKGEKKMLERIITIMTVLAVCFTGAYASVCNEPKGDQTKKTTTVDSHVKSEEAPGTRDRTATSALIASLTKDKGRQVRRNVAQSLGNMEEESAVKALVRHLNDADAAVRKAAYAGLKNIGRPAVQPLTLALKHRNPIVRRQAAQLLGEIIRPRADTQATGTHNKGPVGATNLTTTKVNKKQSEILD